MLEALARAQFDAGRYAAAADNFRRIVEASPSDDYAQFGLGLALARTGDPAAAAEHLALAAAMRPDLGHYTEALRSVRATLSARNQLRHQGRPPIDFERGTPPPSRHRRPAVRATRPPGAAPADAAQPTTAPGPRGSDQPLCAAYDVALLDLDGVIYLGGKAIPGAADALAQAARAGCAPRS